jgi:hypothetical protein
MTKAAIGNYAVTLSNSGGGSQVLVQGWPAGRPKAGLGSRPCRCVCNGCNGDHGGCENRRAGSGPAGQY